MHASTRLPWGQWRVPSPREEGDCGYRGDRDTVTRGRRGGSRGWLEEAQLRQGAVPGPFPAGSHLSAAQARSCWGLEAMIDVASRIADDKRNDVRIEAAIG